MAYDRIRRLLKDGYPWKIKGNGGYTAVLVDTQPLVGHDYEAIYRYPGGECCHDLEEIKSCFTILEQYPPEDEEQPRPVKYGPYLIVWIDKYACWCIYDDDGNKVREPHWATIEEARAAINSREAL